MVGCVNASVAQKINNTFPCKLVCGGMDCDFIKYDANLNESTRMQKDE